MRFNRATGNRRIHISYVTKTKLKSHFDEIVVTGWSSLGSTSDDDFVKMSSTVGWENKIGTSSSSRGSSDTQIILWYTSCCISQNFQVWTCYKCQTYRTCMMEKPRGNSIKRAIVATISSGDTVFEIVSIFFNEIDMILRLRIDYGWQICSSLVWSMIHIVCDDL